MFNTPCIEFLWTIYVETITSVRYKDIYIYCFTIWQPGGGSLKGQTYQILSHLNSSFKILNTFAVLFKILPNSPGGLFIKSTSNRFDVTLIQLHIKAVLLVWQISISHAIITFSFFFVPNSAVNEFCSNHYNFGVDLNFYISHMIL